jgi:hypothetical protein
MDGDPVSDDLAILSCERDRFAEQLGWTDRNELPPPTLALSDALPDGWSSPKPQD